MPDSLMEFAACSVWRWRAASSLSRQSQPPSRTQTSRLSLRALLRCATNPVKLYILNILPNLCKRLISANGALSRRMCSRSLALSAGSCASCMCYPPSLKARFSRLSRPLIKLRAASMCAIFASKPSRSASTAWCAGVFRWAKRGSTISF